MTKPRTPRSVAQATDMAALYADVDSRLAAIEAERKIALGSVNAAADALANPLIEEREALAAALGGWWTAAGHTLLPKNRKSLQLGGCMVGTRASRPALTIAGDEQDVADVLSGLRWAKPMLRVKTSLNKAVLLASLDGKHKMALAEVGIGRTSSEQIFYVERVEQPGTIGATP